MKFSKAGTIIAIAYLVYFGTMLFLGQREIGCRDIGCLGFSVLATMPSIFLVFFIPALSFLNPVGVIIINTLLFYSLGYLIFKNR